MSQTVLLPVFRLYLVFYDNFNIKAKEDVKNSKIKRYNLWKEIMFFIIMESAFCKHISSSEICSVIYRPIKQNTRVIVDTLPGLG